VIKKFILIKNVGRFHNYSTRGDIEFKKLNLFFAENGRGKTTLCSILRSLSTDKNTEITERKTLGSDDPITIEVLVDKEKYKFSDNTWNKNLPEILIFDSVFVHDNVYAGDYIEHDHKKNLHKVMVGEEAVNLTKEIERIDSNIKELNTEINLYKGKMSVPVGIEIDEYLKYQKIEDIDIKIQQKLVEIANETQASKNILEIKSKDSLTKIALPTLPSNFFDVLQKKLEDISIEAENKVKQQIISHEMGNHGENWLSQGLRYVKNETCPFCENDISANDLITSYNSHFNNTYNNLKKEVEHLDSEINAAIGGASLNTVQSTISKNHLLIEFWKQFAQDFTFEIGFEEIQTKYATLLHYALALSKQKKQSPTETILLNEYFNSALNAITSLQEKARIYNDAVLTFNKKIENQKLSIQNKNKIPALEKEHHNLKENKLRFSNEVIEACQNYQTKLSEKTNLENKKILIKGQLDQHCENVIKPYENLINDYLQEFNTGFNIVNTKHDYRGGSPRSSFQIQINRTPIDIGDSNSKGSPSFKSALSSGDKNSLALAFFLVSLEKDPKINEKIIILDDPFTSLDRFRRECTSQLIIKLANRAKQVIVLSHDPHFLKLIKDHAHSISLKEIQILKTNKSSVIHDWNADETTKGSYLKNHSILLNYYRGENTDDLKAAQAMRPFLEEFYRVHFPSSFNQDEWLGDFIKKIRNSDDTSGLSHAKDDVDKLESINEYSKKFHHSDMPEINSDELHGYVSKTLSLVGGHDDI
jgi:wobble nucleotide-excising tRNase